MRRSTLAVDRMSTERLWARLMGNLGTLALMVDTYESTAKIRPLVRESKLIAAEIRLRGVQLVLLDASEPPQGNRKR